MHLTIWCKKCKEPMKLGTKGVVECHKCGFYHNSEPNNPNCGRSDESGRVVCPKGRSAKETAGWFGCDKCRPVGCGLGI